MPLSEDEILVPSLPVFATVELTFKCNNRCLQCGNTVCGNSHTDPLPLKQWEYVLGELGPVVAHMCLSGGEPTLYPDFEEVIGLIKKLNIPFSIFTNARWHHHDSIINTLRSAPQMDQILVSLHGSDAHSHEAFTNIIGSFKETCENILLAAAAGLSVSTNAIITGLNFDRIHEMVQLSKALGAVNVTFSRYLTALDNALTPTEKQIAFAVDAIDKSTHQNEFPIFTSVCIPQCFHTSNLFRGCLAGITSMVVDPQGNVRPCVMTPIQCGNLLGLSIEDIWQGEALENWRRMIPKDCYQCEVLSDCRGGCRAAALMRGRRQDPLIRKPIESINALSLPIVTLPSQARPVGRFEIRPEPFGYLLVYRSQVVPVTRGAKSILDECDGHSEIKEISERYGQGGLDLIATLYRQGLMELC